MKTAPFITFYAIYTIPNAIVNTIKTSAITRYIAINIPFTIPILFIPPNGLSHNYLCIVT